MSTTKDKLVNTVNEWLLKVEDKLKGGTSAIYYSGNTTIGAYGTIELDIKDLFRGYAGYSLLSSRILVKVLDDEPTSLTYGQWINPEAIITVGMHSDGRVKIKSLNSAQVTLMIAINSPNVVL